MAASTLLGAGAVLVAVPLGWTLHELTHLLAAWLLGVPARWQLALRRPMYVEYQTASWWRDRAICLAPALVGLTAAASWLVVVGWPAADGLELLAVVAGWAFYTLDVSADDLQSSVGGHQHETSG